MAFKAPPIEGSISLDNSKFEAGIRDITRQTNGFASNFKSQMASVDVAAAKSARGMGDKFKSQLSEMKSAFGKNSILGSGIKLAMGAGAIGGLSFAGRALGDVADKMGEIKAILNDADATMGDVLEKVASAVPVFGEFWDAGRKFRDVLTGEKAELDDMAAMVKAQADAWAIAKQNVIAAASAVKNMHAAVNGFSQQRQLLEIPDGPARQVAAVKADVQRQIQDLAEETKMPGMDDLMGKKASADEAAAKARRELLVAEQEWQSFQNKGGQHTDESLGAKQRYDAALDANMKAVQAQQNLSAQLKPLQDGELKLRNDYWAGRAEIERIGQLKIQELQVAQQKADVDSFAQKTAALRQSLAAPVQQLSESNNTAGLNEFDKVLDKINNAKDGDGVPLFNQAELKMASKIVEEARALQAGGVLNDLQQQVNQVGMNEFQKKADDLKRNNLLNPDELKKGLELMDKLDAASKAKEFEDKVHSFADSIKTPLEKFNEQMDFLNEAKGKGLIDAQQFDAGVSRADKDAFGDAKLPSLIRAGSAEAMMARFDGRGNSQNSAINLAKQQVKNTDKMVESLNRIVRAVEDDSDVVDLVF